MLIRFVVSNYLSFRKEVEFNMLVESQKWHPEHVYTSNDLQVLKTAALYGANGAGKSNLVKAISLLKKIVMKGDWNPIVDLKPFRLDESCENQPSSFEVEFVKNSKSFVYGISAQGHAIVEEWLYESGLGKDDKKIFTRTTKDGETKIDLSFKYIKNQQDKIRIELYQNEFLNEHSTFLKLISESKESIDDIKSAYDWFKDNLLIVFPRTRPAGLAERLNRSDDFKKFTDNLVCSFHTGIAQIEVTQFDLDQFFGKDDKETADEIRKNLKSEDQIIPLRYPGSREEVIAVLQNGKPVIKRLVNKHPNKEGKLFDFLIGEESDGTVRLFDLIPAIYSALSGENCVIIDEIDQSIHPALLKELIKKFSFDTTTKGQLIFTTHESNLLDQEIFRRDEVWFVEKNKNGETTLYPLSDYDIRADLDIRKGYLQGRFGAIPFTANLHDLKWNKYVEEEPGV